MFSHPLLFDNKTITRPRSKVISLGFFLVFSVKLLLFLYLAKRFVCFVKKKKDLFVLSKKIVFQKKILVPEKLLVPVKFSVQKIFGPKKILGPKKFSNKNRFLVKKNFWS